MFLAISMYLYKQILRQTNDKGIEFAVISSFISFLTDIALLVLIIKNIFN